MFWELKCIKESSSVVLTEKVTKIISLHLGQQLWAAPAVYSCLWSHIIKSVNLHRAVTISHCSGLMPALHVVRLLAELWGEVRGQEPDLLPCLLPCFTHPMRAFTRAERVIKFKPTLRCNRTEKKIQLFVFILYNPTNQRVGNSWSRLRNQPVKCHAHNLMLLYYVIFYCD